jgi:aldose 1-epimerase
VANDDIVLRDALAEARVSARLGAALTAYDFRLRGVPAPVFRPRRDGGSDNPFDLAMNLLAPWSNRISGGGFYHRGRFHALAPNLPGEPFPIHGNAFSAPWRVESQREDDATLALESAGPGPFRYRARVDYRLANGALNVSLFLESLAEAPLPYGLGLHPWLPRSPETLLCARCSRVVLENERHLPAGERPVFEREEWDFRTLRRLPRGWINNAFLDWDGQAEIRWPDRGLALEIAAEPPLTKFILYSPGAGADFFCFEPVTHPVDAHNQGGQGLVELARGEGFAFRCRFAPRPLD